MVTWYEELPDNYFETDTEKAYKESLTRVREGLAQGLGYKEASDTIDVKEGDLRRRIVSDILKVILAEDHFVNKVPLETLSRKLQLPVEFLEAVKQNMVEEVMSGSPEAH